MSDVLCIYYSRTGNTKKAMEEIGAALDAEVVSVTDDVSRSGFWGCLRCGMDAMRKTTQPLMHFETERLLSQYRLVIIGTPIWAGRCSSVIREFLKEYGSQLQNVGYVVTRGSGERFQEVYEQMDHYVPRPHKLAVSLRISSVGYYFWQEEFLRQAKDFLKGEQ